MFHLVTVTKGKKNYINFSWVGINYIFLVLSVVCLVYLPHTVLTHYINI
jgi:hypothetical protein